MKPQTLTIVMPVFNERDTLRASIDRALKVELPLPIELLVVDDGSSDGSVDEIADLVDGRRVRVVQHTRNRGKGAAIRTGISLANGDLLTILDADLEYDPADYRHLLEPILAGEARVSYGTRAFGAHTAYSFWYVVGNKLVNLWASLLYNSWLTDVYTCFKMAYTDIWRRLKLRSEGFGIEAEATARFLMLGERIHEVPISYRARGRLEGKKIRAKDGLEAMLVLAKLRVLGPRG